VPADLVRYVSTDEDSSRWLGFPFRAGDIVISTRSKTGTTWIQMICALLVFQTVELPEPLGRLSPWVDWQIEPRDEVFARLAAKNHRRFMKSHTPLDGIPHNPDVTYIVSGRHPLDMAVSLYHQGENLNRERIRELTGQPEPESPPQKRRPIRDWLLRWIDSDDDPREQLDSLPGVMLHLSDAWQRRYEPNVILVHYDDMCADLETEMRRLAGLLEITVREETWPALVKGATFENMRAEHSRTVPDPSGVLKDPANFFRRGTPGAGTELLGREEIDHYLQRASGMASADMLEWVHHGRGVSG
jgi:aryl sulfotransferase